MTNALNEAMYEQKTVRVRFQVRRESLYGERVLLMGSDIYNTLWDIETAVPMECSDDHIWTLELAITDALNEGKNETKMVPVKFQLQKECLSSDRILLTGYSLKKSISVEIPMVWSLDHIWTAELVAETLPDRILKKMKAPSKEDVPEIKPEQLAEADGFLFGSPSRFGMMAAQLLAFFQDTHELWASQALAAKHAGIFWSTGFHGGGQELTAFTAISQLAHHGIIFVPLGYTFGSGMFEMGQVKGGSSYGAGTYAGDGSREPTALELQQAFYQGSMLRK